jgi:hypothetical protein
MLRRGKCGFMLLYFSLMASGQHSLNERCWPTDGNTSALSNPTFEQDADYGSIFKINGTAASSSPITFIDYEFARPLVIGSATVGRNGTLGCERKHEIERKATKRRWNAIFLQDRIENDWHRISTKFLSDVVRGSTYCYINCFVSCTVGLNEEKIPHSEVRYPRLPTFIWQVDSRALARARSCWDGEISNDMTSSDKSTVDSQEESCSFYGIQNPFVRYIRIGMNADDGRYRLFNLGNRFDEVGGFWFWRKRERRPSLCSASNRHEADKDADKDADKSDPPVSGYSVVSNSFIGNCIIEDNGGRRKYKCPHY